MIEMISKTADRIVEHAALVHPEECAGMLVGVVSEDRKIVVSVWPANNTHADPKRHAFIDPVQVQAFEGQARKKGLDLVGFYHSHPYGDTEPSSRDLKHAMAHFSYLVVAGDQIESWLLREDRTGFDQEELLIADG